MKVGCKGKIYHVHPGVFAPFSSSALYARIHGSWNWKDTSSELIDQTEFDEHTIQCASSFFSARGYCPFQVAPKSDLELGNETKDEDCESTARLVRKGHPGVARGQLECRLRFHGQLTGGYYGRDCPEGEEILKKVGGEGGGISQFGKLESGNICYWGIFEDWKIQVA